jgi:hypothetical protein
MTQIAGNILELPKQNGANLSPHRTVEISAAEGHLLALKRPFSPRGWTLNAAALAFCERDFHLGILGAMTCMPRMRKLYCSAVISANSVLVLGHWKHPASKRLYKSRKPSPSHNNYSDISLIPTISRKCVTQ